MARCGFWTTNERQDNWRACVTCGRRGVARHGGRVFCRACVTFERDADLGEPSAEFAALFDSFEEES